MKPKALDCCGNHSFCGMRWCDPHGESCNSCSSPEPSALLELVPQSSSCRVLNKALAVIGCELPIANQTPHRHTRAVAGESKFRGLIVSAGVMLALLAAAWFIYDYWRDHRLSTLGRHWRQRGGRLFYRNVTRCHRERARGSLRFAPRLYGFDCLYWFWLSW